jgi:hypothetical protein
MALDPLVRSRLSVLTAGLARLLYLHEFDAAAPARAVARSGTEKTVRLKLPDGGRPQAGGAKVILATVTSGQAKPNHGIAARAF